jgi:hypothetical protein
LHKLAEGVAGCNGNEARLYRVKAIRPCTSPDAGASAGMGALAERKSHLKRADAARMR